MKRFTIAFLLAPIFLAAQTKTGAGFSIQGTIKGVVDNSVVTFTDLNNPGDTIARTLVKKGVFNLAGVIKEANLYQVNFHQAQKKFILFMGNEKVTVTGDIANVQNFVVKGSTIHDDFTEFQSNFTPLVSRLSDLNRKIASTPDIQRSDTVMIAYQENISKIKTTIDNFVDNKKTSPVTPFVVLVTSEIDQDPQLLENRFNRLTKEQQGGFYGKILHDQIADSKIGAVGTDAIPFVQSDTIGKPVSLASFKGKYVLVDFWASWCQPCRMENPNVVEAFNRFKKKNFTVLGVSLDKSKENWLKAIHDDGLAWTHVSDLQYWNNEVAQKYRIQSIPQNFLVGPDGKIVGRNLRGNDLQAKLCELLGCN